MSYTCEQGISILLLPGSGEVAGGGWLLVLAGPPLYAQQQSLHTQHLTHAMQKTLDLLVPLASACIHGWMT